MSESTRTVLLLLLLILIALVGGRFLFRAGGKGRPRGFFRLGFPVYLGLGLVLGGQGMGILQGRLLANLEPVMELALGWTGLLFGLQFSLRQLKRYPAGYPLTTLFQGAATMLVLCAAMLPLFRRLFPPAEGVELWGALIVLAAVGAISSPSSTALAARMQAPVRRRLAQLAHYVSSFDAMLPLLVFSIMTGYLREGSGSWRLAVEWAAVSVLVGLILGLLFYSFARHRHGENELTFLILAFTVFSGGIASYLGLSSLFVNVVVGFVLANRLEVSERIFRVLAEREKPILIVFLVLVGASWEVASAHRLGAVLPVLAVYLAARSIGKLGSMAAVRPLFGDRLEAGSGLSGLALLGQGGMSVALVANYQLLFEGQVCSLVVSVALPAVVLGEMFGAWAARFALAEKKKEAG
ncbi:MAG: cation:proton antiporter [Candidatus Glassbacteria bacterium]|nr:cation:proton antiporter [Candidatus Glassbacteria bacterium]